MLSLMQQLPSVQAPGEVQAVLDLGCATGLSSLALAQLFPAAQITGVDLSPHMVAVGRYHQERRQVRTAAASLLAAAL
jgi:trans-aconitate methyltransferase